MPFWKYLLCGGLILVVTLAMVWAILPFRGTESPRILPSGNIAPGFRISQETIGFTEPVDEEGYLFFPGRRIATEKPPMDICFTASA